MATTNTLPDPPAQLKAIQSFMKIASDIERVDPVVAYWTRLFSTETALKIDRESPECKSFLGALIVWLENFKQTHKGNEAVSNQTVGQAHVENFVMALFNKADTLDREGTANKNTVRMFFMAAVLFEAMAVFGPLTEEISKRSKYAKFKAAYIQKCLKTGQTPKPGPLDGPETEDPGNPPQPETSKDTISTPLDIPEVPEDSEKGDNFTKQDPYIMTPSSAPIYPPALPNTPNKPSSGYSEPSAVPRTAPSQNPANNTSMNEPTVASTIQATKFHATNGSPLNAEAMMKSQKYCKFASSALQYDDVPTAVANLEKALKLLTTGQNPE